jgi:hypothetical protein
MVNAVSRRVFVGLALAGATSFALGHFRGASHAAVAKLKAGQFVWQPERSPEGAVVIVVSLPEQLVHVYRNGAEIGISTCSTGRKDHRTPTGVFTILQKQRVHHSSIYNNAPMPNMERLTWKGVALHAGHLPGYPASHGCIRLPHKFSELLYGVTHTGTVVIVADEHTQPRKVVHPGLLLPDAAKTEARLLARQVASAVAKRRAPSAWSATVNYATVSLVISVADGMAYLMRDGVLEASLPIVIAGRGRPLGSHVYSLVGPTADGSGLAWLALAVGKLKSEAHIVKWSGDKVLSRIQFADPDRARALARSLHPGATLVVTDNAAPPATRDTPDDFSVITSEPF